MEAGKKVDYGDQGVTVEGTENDLAVLPAGGCRCQQVTAVVAGRRVALDPLRTSFRQPRLGRLSAQESRNRKRPVASTLWILRPQPWGGDPAEGQSGAAVLMGARLKRPAASQTAAEPGEGAADAEKVGVVGAQREPERDLANARYDRPDACDLWVIGKEVLQHPAKRSVLGVHSRIWCGHCSLAKPKAASGSLRKRPLTWRFAW